jgi:hypothetical protein
MVDEKLARRFHRGLAHAFDNRYLLTLQLDQNRDFAAERKVRKLNHRRGENCRYTRVNGVSTALQDPESGFD